VTKRKEPRIQASNSLPPGATLGYDRQTGKVVAKNTYENLERIDIVLKRISRANQAAFIRFEAQLRQPSPT